MAMSGGTAVLVHTGYSNGNTSAPIRLYVYYKSTQSIANNQSTISCGMYVVPSSGWPIGTWNDFNGSYVGTKSLTFDGTMPYIESTYWLAENKTFTVNHNSDGTGTATIYWKWGVNSPWGRTENPSGSFTITLPTIARASEMSFSSSSPRMGNSLTIYTNRKSSAFTHTLKYTLNGSTGTIATGVGSSYSWTIPDLVSKVPNVTSSTITITCTTYNGSTVVGTDTANLTLLLPEVAAPTVSASTVKMGNSVTINTNRKSSAYKHTIKYYFNGKPYSMTEDAEGSFVWTVPKSLASETNNSKSATCTITCTAKNGSATVGTQSISITLTVPDATVPTVDNASINLGEIITVNMPRETSAYEHDMTYTLKAIGSSAVAHSGTVGSGGYNLLCRWTVPLSLASKIPSATKGTITATVITRFKDSTVEIGRNSVSFTVNVPDNSETKPAATMSLTPSSELSSKFSGLFIQGKTKVSAAFTASSDYSTIDSYGLTVEGVTKNGNPIVSDFIVSNGSLTVDGFVKDARGYRRDLSETITVIPYSKPKVIPSSGYSNVVCERSNSSGIANPNGEYLHIKCGRKYSKVTDGGTQKNFCILQYRCKTASATDFPDTWTPLIAKNSLTSDYVDVTLSGVVQSVTTAYSVQLCAEDDVGDLSIISIAVPAASTPLHLGDGGKNVGIGQFCDYSEQNRIDVGWPVHFNTGIGKRVIFEAESGGWPEGALLSSSFPDADMAAVMQYTVFLAVLESTKGTAGNIHPVLCVRASNRIYGSLIMSMLDTDTIRSISVYMRYTASENSLELRRCRMLYHTPDSTHGSIITLDDTTGTNDKLMITALYALI